MAYYERRGVNSWRIRDRVHIGGHTYVVGDTLRFPASMSESQQLAAVQEAVADLEEDIRTGAIQLPTQDVTIKDFSTIYIRDYVEPSTSAANLRTFRSMLRQHILPELGHVQLRRLSAHQLEQFFVALKRKPKATRSLPPDQRANHTMDPNKLAEQMHEYQTHIERMEIAPELLSPRTIHQIYVYLEGMLSHATTWGYLTNNPIKKVTVPKYRKRKMHTLDDDEAVELLRKLSEVESIPFRCAVLLALVCGLRLGEVGALRFSDVHFSEGWIDITRALKVATDGGAMIGDPKSEAGDRRIDLPDGMLTILEETRAYHRYAAGILGERWRGCDRIVCNWDGSPYHHDTPSKQWRKFADANGYPGLRFHELRHTHATLLLANNIDVVAVAARMGHSNPSVTLKEYAHALRKRDAASAAFMQDLFSRAAGSSEDQQLGNPQE